ncbi:MAG: hypothetical protein E7335_01570 [Clostridiales bacterium]|nr:hypothetical protein [Clostridiales bacterium]
MAQNIRTMSVGTPVDLAPWSYIWRSDKAVQDKPEADFIPRRIKRQDEVYRTLVPTLGKKAASHFYPDQTDCLKEQLPPAKGKLLTGALWVGNIEEYEIELIWPEGACIPAEEDVEVRAYPTAWGWFGFSVDQKLIRTKQDGNSWLYPCLPGEMMDIAYGKKVRAATQVIAVFAPEGAPVPEIHITGDDLGAWKEVTFTVEWGFADNLPPFTGKMESSLAVPTIIEMDTENRKARISCLYSEEARYGCDSKLTLITDEAELMGATVLLRELANAPICVPEAGLFFCPADKAMTAQEYMDAQKAQGKKTVAQQVREHEESQSWEQLIRNLRLWRCPDGTELTPFPESPAPAVPLRVPDKRWETMYNLAVEQLRGKHMWGFLALEVARATMASELTGLHAEADRVYDYFLASPGIKPDADYSTGEGSLEWAKTMQHDIGYGHEGTHFSTGKMLYSMMHRYYLTADKAWVEERLPRLKKAADWIISERNGYMKDTANREELLCYGMMPPAFLGDYAAPSSDWHWYHMDNVPAYAGLAAFADVLTQIGDASAEYYTKEAKAFERDLIAMAKREGLYSPVRRARDGISRSFISRMLYSGGLLHFQEETNIPQYNMGINDLFQGALPLGDIGGVLDPYDRRIVGTLTAMTERGMTLAGQDDLENPAHPTATEEEKELRALQAAESAAQIRTGRPPAEDMWFWSRFADLPKISHNANVYLRQDDIPNFLYFFFNHVIAMVGSDGRLWEHPRPDTYIPCDNPDNGTAAWFTENFRNMLLMEDRDTLWLAKGTPRAWLKQDCTIEAINAPTLYGYLTYSIHSDVASGAICASVDVPSRKEVPTMKLRLRHPDKAKIKSVLVNGAPYANIDADGETVTFEKPQGKLEIRVEY